MISETYLGEATDSEKTLAFKIMEKDKEIERLHSIIKELDDYIDEHTELNHDGDDYGYMEWYDTKGVDLCNGYVKTIPILLRY